MDWRLANQIERWSISGYELTQQVPFQRSIRERFPAADEETVREAYSRITVVAAVRGFGTTVSPDQALDYWRENRLKNDLPVTVGLDALMRVTDERGNPTGRFWTLRIQLEPGDTYEDYLSEVQYGLDASNSLYPGRRSVVVNRVSWAA